MRPEAVLYSSRNPWECQPDRQNIPRAPGKPLHKRCSIVAANYWQKLYQLHMVISSNSLSANCQESSLSLLASPLADRANIKAITQISYSVEEPTDYWAIRGYSKYQGI